MTSQDPEMYLAILKASYDYEPQSEDEIDIKENQLLLLIERVDEESVLLRYSSLPFHEQSLRWWKVKVKGTSQDIDNPIGLVPAAYVEQVNHILHRISYEHVSNYNHRRNIFPL